ncbi:Kunitz/Bovine pancreatic trypsin inhibitor domain protein [Necator americanus]|uniref:Kunitz/Bovine pancreatic trypsin inhibitor domain protein n=1 Tax=Necator americanus TaxID=51031 RepID=W2TUH8_NECAM|nr:Kunitz/Bovine pancreatic trypsin inhibitor domain protein [Necator americanus]ETN85468.1 Kunitz/Bovine pancreatic trypsin inhibitor domain protein [Necator americanus]
MMQSVIAIVLFAAAASAIPSRCYEGIVTGPCRAMHERYAYDPAKGECVRFNYGGCAGNNNNFMSKLECQLKKEQKIYSICGVGNTGSFRTPKLVTGTSGVNIDEMINSGRPTACSLPIETGVCFAAFRRYAFDDTQGRCVSFIYGGCGGNENNFETLEECENTCLNTIQRYVFG